VVPEDMLKYIDFFRVSHVPHVRGAAGKVGHEGREVNIGDVAFLAELPVKIFNLNLSGINDNNLSNPLLVSPLLYVVDKHYTGVNV
jgi:hypothetical protein